FSAGRKILPLMNADDTHFASIGNQISVGQRVAVSAASLRSIGVNRSLLHADVKRGLVMPEAANAALNMFRPFQCSVAGAIGGNIAVTTSGYDPPFPQVRLFALPCSRCTALPCYVLKLIGKGHHHAGLVLVVDPRT